MTRRKNDQIGFCECVTCEERGQVSKEKGSNRLYYNCEGDCGCVRVRGQRFQDHIIRTFTPLDPGADPREVLGLPPLEPANDPDFTADENLDAESEPVAHETEVTRTEIEDSESNKPKKSGWFGEL